MRQVFRIFFTAENTRPLAVLACLLLAGFAEAISLTALLPTIQQIGGEAGMMSNSPATRIIEHLLSFLGLAPTLPNLILVVVAFFSLKAILSFVALSYAGIAVARVSTAIRRKLITALFNARWSFYTQQQTGHVANTMSGDAYRAGTAYSLAAQFVAFSVQAVVYCVVAFLVTETGDFITGQTLCVNGGDTIVGI